MTLEALQQELSALRMEVALIQGKVSWYDVELTMRLAQLRATTERAAALEQDLAQATADREALLAELNVQAIRVAQNAGVARAFEVLSAPGAALVTRLLAPTPDRPAPPIDADANWTPLAAPRGTVKFNLNPFAVTQRVPSFVDPNPMTDDERAFIALATAGPITSPTEPVTLNVSNWADASGYLVRGGERVPIDPELLINKPAP